MKPTRPEILKMPETQQQFLDAIIWWFSENPRCIIENPKSTIKYRAIYGRQGCAIGIWMSQEQADELDSIYVNGVLASHPEVVKRLPDPIFKLTPRFLRYVQRIHDDDTFWTKTGINHNNVVGSKLLSNYPHLRINPIPHTGNPYLIRPQQ